MIIRAIKDTLKRYKELREEHRLLKRIVSMPLDYEMLQTFINGSDREIELRLNDGTTIIIKDKGVSDNDASVTFKDKFKRRWN